MEGTDELKCDFCGRDKPTTVYPCSDFAVLMRGLPPQGSKGPFTACAACAAFIDAKDIKGLVKRYAGFHVIPHALRPTRKKLLSAYWGKFFELREPGRPIDPQAVFEAHTDKAAIALSCKVVEEVRVRGETKLAYCENNAAVELLLYTSDKKPLWVDACPECARDTLDLEPNAPLEHERIRSRGAGKDERTKGQPA